MAAYAVPGRVLPPPEYLTEEQRRFWKALVDPFPPERFSVDHESALVELVRHQAIAAQLNEQLSALRRRDLNRDSKSVNATRRIFLQLADAARHETRIITSISTKLRLLDQSKERKSLATARREQMGVGPKPWETHLAGDDIN
jgi:hypothetical protein